MSSNNGSTGNNELFVDYSSGSNIGITFINISSGDIIIPYDYENNEIRNIPLTFASSIPASWYR